MKILGQTFLSFLTFLVVASCNNETNSSGAQTESHSIDSIKLPPSQELLLILALHESAIREAWDNVGDRLLAGEIEIFYQGSHGKIAFLRAEEDRGEPARTYMVGGAVLGTIEIARSGEKVESVIMRPGEFGMPYPFFETTVTLYDINKPDLFSDDAGTNNKQNKAEMATPRKPSD